MRRRILVSVIERAIRAVGIVASAIVLISFGLFALDQARAGSQREQDKLAQQDSADPTAAQERQREKKHSGVREGIDDADDFLLSPFTGIADSGGDWVRRGVPAGIALVVYGFGLGFLARFARGLAR
ncbi:MAG: hypothetical protein QOD76_438 [Solirubrobacteraceae bacterium]|jgi:hypothetical protein|nr:hypothetical protein [Solirubrobacteraceae bacterium]